MAEHGKSLVSCSVADFGPSMAVRGVVLGAEACLVAESRGHVVVGLL